MQPPKLSSIIKREALALGFDAAGIALASALKAGQEDLTLWISAGFSGQLQYMKSFFERQARLQSNFSDLKSIIVVTVSYYSNSPHPAPQPGTGRIARYAWGRDYHRAIKKRLKRLERFIRSQVPDSSGIRIVRSVDTSPLQERVLAEKSGLGFFGKNTCLIRPNGGSFFFLGALLTNLNLVPDEPIQWNCGSCTLCLEACPTGALVRPYELDARRCISYLTIEMKETIDPHLRPLMKDWIFGCDICQEVCPYNRKAKETGWAEFKPRFGAGTQIPLDDVLECRSDQAFLGLFAGTPLMRAKRIGLARNAAITAGNSRNPHLIRVLGKTLLEESSPLVRGHAAWALGKIGTKEAIQLLQSAITKETDPVVLTEIKAALTEPIPFQT